MTAPDPKILAEAIKRSEADMQLFRGIDDPEIKKLVEFCEVILVAAKAYEPMLKDRDRSVFALTKAAEQFELYGREHREKARVSRGNGLSFSAIVSDGKGRHQRVLHRRNSALNQAR